MILILLIISVVVLALIYFYSTFTYWDRKKIVSYPSPHPIMGHMSQKFSEQLLNMYSYFKSKGLKHGGFYFCHQPIYMPIDPDILKQIMTKDFDYFNAKGLYTNEEKQPINMHLFAIGGDRWKKLRVKLTPTFTSGKMKSMFPTILECAKPLVENIKELSKANIDVDIKDVASKYTTDVIGSCAFGIECNSFKNSNSDFHQMGKKLLKPSTKGMIKRAFGLSFPKLCRALGVTMLPQDAEDFYTNITKDNIKYREENNVSRNDFLQLMMNLQEKGVSESGISTQEIVNQSFVFYIAGYETSSTVMTYALVELSQNIDVQEKVRKEVLDVLKKHNNEITYDSIHDMKYLEQVVDETLRKYPPVIVLNRECTKPYKVPGTDVTLDAGTKVFIPVLPLQHDAEYYPEPDQFDPERFSDENKRLRHPYAFLPFGEGPRQCIGLRFGMLQTKIGLASLLREHKFALHPNVKYPIEFGKGFLALFTKDPILLKSTPL